MGCDTVKVAIIDDEPIYIDEMIKLCRKFESAGRETVTVASFSGGQAFLDVFQPDAYQVVFLDIFMDGMGGIETARRLREMDTHCFLVFLTSSDEFMPDAFSLHAFDYIVKPVSEEKVFRVLADVCAHLPELPPFLEITSGRQTIPLLLTDIVSVVSDAHYLNIQVKSGECFRCRMTVSRFLALAGNDPRFLAANRGVLINADYIRSIDGQRGVCTLTDGSVLPIRLRESQRLENALRQYHFSQIRKRQKTSDKRKDASQWKSLPPHYNA